jgi:hypothetical protein
VRGRDEHGAIEVGLVGELVQKLRELALRRREAHVDHVEPLVDRPAEAGQEHGAAALEAGPEDAGADEAALRRELADDSRTGCAVAAEVALGVLDDLDLVLVVAVEGDGAFDFAHARMAGLDPAVEDADADALSGRAAEGPVAGDTLGPVDADRDPVTGPGREAPRG